jgi:hypothetical protein
MHGYGQPGGVQYCVRLFLAMALLIPALAAAQPQDSPKTEPKVDVDELPVSVPRVQRELQRPQTLNLEATEPLFRIEVTADRPRWLTEIDWLGTQDRVGPIVPHPTPHEQFLARVTPQLAQPYQAFSQGELLQVVITSFLQGLAMKQGVQALKDELRRRREEEARREVDRAIEQWKEQLEQQRKQNANEPPPP